MDLSRRDLVNEVKDEISDQWADKARDLWQSMRESDFHNGRNKIAALLRDSNSSLHSTLAAVTKERDKLREIEAKRFDQVSQLVTECYQYMTERDELRARLGVRK